MSLWAQLGPHSPSLLATDKEDKGIHRANKGGKKNEKLGNASKLWHPAPALVPSLLMREVHTEDVTDKVGNAPKPVNKTHKVSDSKPSKSKAHHASPLSATFLRKIGTRGR